MKKLSILFVLILCLAACSKQESNLFINGAVKGLKEGTLYLQKIEDTVLVTIDSLEVKGDPNFVFETNIESPQVMYLFLKKMDGSSYNDRLLFFAEPGEMSVTTTLKNFETDVVVEGSVNHKKLEEHRKIMERFNDQNLDLIKISLEAQKAGNEELVAETNLKFDNLLKRRYLYTVNFALNNKDYEVAPYLAVSEIFDANIKYLDTIQKSLSPEVRDSKYGKSLTDFIKERRKLETKAAAPVAEVTAEQVEG